MISFVFLFVVPCNMLLAEEQIVVFEVKGMSCGSCTFILKRTLRTIDSVGLAKVYYDKRLAVVVFENTVADIQQLLEAKEEWDINSPNQWGEPYVMLTDENDIILNN